jgi:hypothetical protein
MPREQTPARGGVRLDEGDDRGRDAREEQRAALIIRTGPYVASVSRVGGGTTPAAVALMPVPVEQAASVGQSPSFSRWQASEQRPDIGCGSCPGGTQRVVQGQIGQVDGKVRSPAAEPEQDQSGWAGTVNGAD